MSLPIDHIIHGDALTVLKTFPDACIDCVVTSPPYWSLRDYGVAGQLGLEPTLEAFLQQMLAITAELKRVLKPTGTLWWNHGDCYSTGGKAVSHPSMSLGSTLQRVRHRDYIPPLHSGVPAKSLVLQNYRLALRMIDEQGWILRNQIIWHKPNVMPASVRDRFTVDYEPLFFFTKSPHYYFDRDTVREPYQSASLTRLYRAVGPTHKHFQGAPGQTPQGLHVPRAGSTIAPHPKGRHKRCVWTIAVRPFREAHFATFPTTVVEAPIKAGCPPGGIVLDPFLGSGTTAVVARALGRRYIGIELNPDYIAIANRRLQQGVLWAA